MTRGIAPFPSNSCSVIQRRDESRWHLAGDCWYDLPDIGTALFSVPLGIGAAIYLSEYAPTNRLTQIIRIAIITLAGIPSVVYGLFGLGLFVLCMKFGTSILAGSLTLAIMNIPVIISTTEEALRSVPQAFRVVSISLGATRWQTIRRIIVPQALPGIITGMILGMERAAGETAPILFTAAAFYLPRLPHSPLDQTMALPYHLYVISTQVPGMPEATAIRHGTGTAGTRVWDEPGCNGDPLQGSRPPPMVNVDG